MERQYTGIDSVRELLDRDLKAITEEELKMSAKRHSSLLETTMNTRDLGGYETGTPGVKTKYNRVYRSDKQNYPSERDIDFLKSNQVTTIIDMRGAEDIVKSSRQLYGDCTFREYIPGVSCHRGSRCRMWISI